MFVTDAIVGVVKPLMVILPDTETLDGDIAAPDIKFGLTVALTPVCAETKLMAAAFAIELAAEFDGKETVSLVVYEAPTVTPLISTSLACKGFNVWKVELKFNVSFAAIFSAPFRPVCDTVIELLL